MLRSARRRSWASRRSGCCRTIHIYIVYTYIIVLYLLYSKCSSIYLLDVPQCAHILVLDEVDGYSLAPEAARPADAVYVQLAVGGEVVVDDQ